ncbi:hypothetical protein COO91_10544 (plasmid) [Nostoc flagelliforme CCNUN1]|uniref:Uncharacterized protein n=1 Tax=Nostoc flagelliforme CCNUN1 TaxID=2038116 RepID=A0A2K8T9J1_9NOSO|nr:hypothetical protein COO91_10544 [Nostoc flagelliforme CCNUN1]
MYSSYTPLVASGSIPETNHTTVQSAIAYGGDTVGECNT